MIVEAIRGLVEGRDLSPDQARAAMGEIMDGLALPSQIGAFLTALRMKGETVAEISSFAEVMRARVRRVESKAHPRLLDTCGTGGDSTGSFNISTAAALVAAGAGIPVAKHGNRSVSSACGSADVLAALGVRIDAPPELVERALDLAGIAFIFAPLFHPAMKNAIGPRREIAIRTVFNVLGPLTNPAGAQCQLLGVYHPELTAKLAGVLERLGSSKAYVVHGAGGLDELSIYGPSTVSALEDGAVRTFELTPEEFGLPRREPGALRGGDVADNARDHARGAGGTTRPIPRGGAAQCRGRDQRLLPGADHRGRDRARRGGDRQRGGAGEAGAAGDHH